MRRLTTKRTLLNLIAVMHRKACYKELDPSTAVIANSQPPLTRADLFNTTNDAVAEASNTGGGGVYLSILHEKCFQVVGVFTPGDVSVILCFSPYRVLFDVDALKRPVCLVWPVAPLAARNLNFTRRPTVHRSLRVH